MRICVTLAEGGLEMERLRLVKEFLGIDDETEAKAWCLFVDMLRAMSDAEAGLISKADADNAHRQFELFLMQHDLKMLSDEDGLEPGEFAIIKRTTSEMKRVNSMDILLLMNNEDICEVLIAEDVRDVAGFPDNIIRFLAAPNVHEWLKERIIERDPERGERLLRAVIDEVPDDIYAHFMLTRKYEKDGRTADAEAEYRRFLRIRDDGIVWANYGWLLERMGRYDDALRAFERASSLIQSEMGGDYELVDELQRSISRVSRMRNLRGEDAMKAHAYQQAVWLINEVKGYAEMHFGREMEIAREEFMEAENIEEMSEEDEMEFMNWFLFTRSLPDGRTPAVVFADERGLDEDTKAKLKHLGSPKSGIYEIISYEPDAFRIRVRNLLSDEEYELMADIEGIEVGQTFSGNLYPWGDIYLSGGALRIHSPELSDEIKSVVESFSTSDSSESEDKREELHNAFTSFFGSWEAVFDTKEACEDAINRFLDWFFLERKTEIGKTIAEIYREEHGEEMKREPFKIPQSFESAKNIGVLSDAEEGIFLVQDYGILKNVIENGSVSAAGEDAPEMGKDEIVEKIRAMFIEMEIFVLRNLLQSHRENVINVLNEVFNAELPEDADVDNVVSFIMQMREQRETL
ncbi:hypothetical protein DRN79_04390 [Methanosarcinales archaeon]|nr:MAG: hypothetical protein DRN79_04390 [Methanosarcinales archaeon]